MIAEHPVRQILIATQNLWDRPSTPDHIRKAFRSILDCGTIALGAEVYASATQRKIVYHTCKSRFCPSCGQRATEAWQEELQIVLPDIPYVGLTFTMPEEFWPILQENRDLLHCIPAIAANAIAVWAKIKYGVRLLTIVVQQTFGGFLNFYPHLHIMVSAGGLQETRNRWLNRIAIGKEELMPFWRSAVVFFLEQALKMKLIPPTFFGRDLTDILKDQSERKWHVNVTPAMSKAHFLEYAGRYIRRPPIARYRLTVVSDGTVAYLGKDTRNNTFRRCQFSTDKFLHILMQHVQEAGWHGMRYFGLLAPRSIAKSLPAVFMLLGQKRRPKPPRTDWATLRRKCFGKDPLIDDQGQRMQWSHQLSPVGGAC